MNKRGIMTLMTLLVVGVSVTGVLASYANQNMAGTRAAYAGQQTSPTSGGWGMMGGWNNGYSYPAPSQNAAQGLGGYMGGCYNGGYTYTAPNSAGQTTWLNDMWGWCGRMMGGLWGGQPQTQQNLVRIAGYGFNPQVTNVKVGTSVTWTNYDSVIHSIRSGTPSSPSTLFDSGNLTQGQSFSYTFTNAGVYTYFCDEHPGMTGVVIVES